MRKLTFLASLALLTPMNAFSEPLQSFDLTGRIKESGQTTTGVRFYKVTTTSAKTLLFNVSGDAACMYSLQKGGARDYRSATGIFPIEFSDTARRGEVYIFNFSQTRPAWLAGTPCIFSFTVE
ncbi:hypothetical protein [Rhizobium sp. KDH_Rht_773_N]